MDEILDQDDLEMEESQPPVTLIKPRLRCVDCEREDPRPRRIEELIEEDHPARIVWDFVSGLDLSELYAKVRAVEGQPGSPAIDARILMAVWLYAIIDHQTSARRGLPSYARPIAPTFGYVVGCR